MARTRTARRLLAAAAAGSLLAVAACGGEAESGGSGASADFPEDQFPQEIFGDLSGSLTWYDGSGGATTEARNQTIWQNFTELTGVTTQNDFTGDTAKFFATMESGAPVPWNLIEFPTQGDFIKARDAGYLQEIDTSVVPVEEMEEGSYDEYGINVLKYGIVPTFNTEAYPESGEQPDDLADLLDTETFPGKRCMYQYPQFGGTLEAALLADGVAPEDLYPLDVERALAKLDTIKDDIVWWSDGDESLRLLTSGECDLGVAWSGRVFNAVNKDNAPLDITWNNAIYTTAVYAVPEGATDPEVGQAAMSMWIRDREGQQEFVSRIPYPTPIEGLEYDESVQSWLPNGANEEAAIEEDAQYYAENIGDLVEAFNTWVSQG